SREEAASLANGVERSHYLDLVREALYDELAPLAIGEPLLADSLRNTAAPRHEMAARFADAHPDEEAHLAQLLRAAHAPVPDIDDADMVALLQERKRVAQEAEAALHERLVSRTVPLRLLFDDAVPDRTPGALILGLKRLGVNPAGNDVLYQQFGYDNRYHRWTKLFDW